MPETPKKTLEEHLMSRELVDFDILTVHLMNGTEPQGVAELTLNEEVLKQVATAWETYRPAIIAVISARIKQLTIQLTLRDIPQEVLVTRQSIMELIGVLSDFEKLHRESIARSQNKPQNETAQEGA